MTAARPLILPNINGLLEGDYSRASKMDPKIKLPTASPLKSIEKSLKNQRSFTVEDGQITPASTPPSNYDPRRNTREVQLLLPPKMSPLKVIEANSSPAKVRPARIRTDSEMLNLSETEILLSTQIRLPKLEHIDHLLSAPLESPTKVVASFSPSAKPKVLSRADSIVIAPTASPLKVLERSRSLMLGTDTNSPWSTKQKGARMYTASFDSGANHNKPALERSVSYRQPNTGEVEMVWDYHLKTFVVAKRK